MVDRHIQKETSLRWTTSRVLNATGGKLLFGKRGSRFSGISIDSRTVSPGVLFIGIVGEKYDGHRFAPDAVAQGARGILMEKTKIRRALLERFEKQGILCISVPNTTRALGDLAAYHRRRWGGRVISITGSNGKTSTRRMIADVVRQGHPVLSTVGNYNNEIGVPLTLLNLRPEHRWAVVELGMNHPGEIDRLAEICLPDIGVITNIAPAHLEGVGSVEGVVNAKGELLDRIQKGGAAVLNADDPNTLNLIRRAGSRVILFGKAKGAAVRATHIRETRASVRFLLRVSGKKSVPVRFKTTGKFLVSNALAAASVGTALDFSPNRIRKGLEAFIPEKGRLAVLTLKGGICLMDDTYNANPGSMMAAMDTLMRLNRNKGRSHLVLGDMLELGDQSQNLHRQIGAYVKKAQAYRLYVTGKFAGAVAAGAVEAGMRKKDITVGPKETIQNVLFSEVNPGDWILVKGSRGMAMETVVQAVKTWAEKDGNAAGIRRLKKRDA